MRDGADGASHLCIRGKDASLSGISTANLALPVPIAKFADLRLL